MSQALAADVRDDNLSRSAWILSIGTLVVVAAAYGPMLWQFFVQQFEKPEYQYFPFVIGAFVWLLWSRLGEAEPQEVEAPRSRLKSVASWLVLAFAWIVLGVSFFSDSPWLAAISGAAFSAWGFLRISRRRQVPYLWGIWTFWLLVIPLPLRLDKTLISFLQRVSSKFSSFVLDLFGVAHLMEGNTLLLPDKKLFVDEACSGIISVLSIIACALIYGVWRRRPPLHLFALILAGVAWATVMNVLRIVTIACVYTWFGIDWSSGTPHEILSLCIFTCTFLGLVSTDLALAAALAPITPTLETQSAAEPTYGAWFIRAWDWLQEWRAPAAPPDEPTIDAGERASVIRSSFALGIVPLVGFGLLAGGQWAQGLLLASGSVPETHALDRALVLKADSLDPNYGKLRRIRFTPFERERDAIEGAHTRSFEYRGEHGEMFNVSCDFPFGPDWHDLTACYIGNGWEPLSRRTEKPASPADAEWEYVAADFRKPDGSAGFLAYTAFDEVGERENPPFGSLWRDAVASLTKKRRNARPEKMIQVQVWTVADGAVSPEQQREAVDLLLKVRQQLYDRVLSELPAASPSQTAEKLPSGS